MSNKTTLLAAAELATQIARIGKDNASLASRIQSAAVECIGQSIVHRNITPAQQLYDNLGTSQRRDSLMAYFEKFGNMAWSKADKKIVFYDVEKMTEGKTILAWTEDYVDVVAGSKWDAAKRASETVSKYDVAEEVSKFIDRMHKQVTKGADVKNSELLAELTNVVNRYNFKHYVRLQKVSLEDELAAVKAEEVEAARLAAAAQQ